MDGDRRGRVHHLASLDQVLDREDGQMKDEAHTRKIYIRLLYEARLLGRMW